MKRQRQFYMEEIQQQWICPITNMPINDPVVLSDGHSYEKEDIIEWLNKQKRSPKTGLMLSSSQVYPNIALKNVINKWQKQIKYEIQKLIEQNNNLKEQNNKYKHQTKKQQNQNNLLYSIIHNKFNHIIEQNTTKHKQTLELIQKFDQILIQNKTLIMNGSQRQIMMLQMIQQLKSQVYNLQQAITVLQQNSKFLSHNKQLSNAQILQQQIIQPNQLLIQSPHSSIKQSQIFNPSSHTQIVHNQSIQIISLDQQHNDNNQIDKGKDNIIQIRQQQQQEKQIIQKFYQITSIKPFQQQILLKPKFTYSKAKSIPIKSISKRLPLRPMFKRVPLQSMPEPIPIKPYNSIPIQQLNNHNMIPPNNKYKRQKCFLKQVQQMKKNFIIQSIAKQLTSQKSYLIPNTKNYYGLPLLNLKKSHQTQVQSQKISQLNNSEINQIPQQINQNKILNQKIDKMIQKNLGTLQQSIQKIIQEEALKIKSKQFHDINTKQPQNIKAKQPQNIKVKQPQNIKVKQTIEINQKQCDDIKEKQPCDINEKQPDQRKGKQNIEEQIEQQKLVIVSQKQDRSLLHQQLKQKQIQNPNMIEIQIEIESQQQQIKQQKQQQKKHPQQRYHIQNIDIRLYDLNENYDNNFDLQKQQNSANLIIQEKQLSKNKETEPFNDNHHMKNNKKSIKNKNNQQNSAEQFIGILPFSDYLQASPALYDYYKQQLDHSRHPIDMQEFLKHDWKQIISLKLNHCRIQDKMFQTFLKQGVHFPNLTRIQICNFFITEKGDNNIKNIPQFCFIAFENLKQVYFSVKKKYPNRLSCKAKTYLQLFKTQNPNVKIQYHNQ